MFWARAARPFTRLVATRSMATEAAAKRDGLMLTFGSQSNAFYKDTKVKQVDVPTFSGALGILADHVPILAVLKPGLLTVHEEDGSSKKFVVAAGTVTMNEDSSLLILAAEAVAVDDLDVSEAQKHLAVVSSQSTPEAKVEAEVYQAVLESAR